MKSGAQKMCIQIIAGIIFCAAFSTMCLFAEENSPENALPENALIEKINTTNITEFTKDFFLGEELIVQLPALNPDVDDIYYPGLGGGFVYEFYFLNRIFTGKSLPGIILGLSATLLVFSSDDENKTFFGDSLMFLPDIYLGYQFYFPVTKAWAFSPALFGGIKYFVDLHFYKSQLYSLYNPILLAGCNLNFIFNNFAILAARIEANYYFQVDNVFVLQFALRAGFLL